MKTDLLMRMAFVAIVMFLAPRMFAQVVCVSNGDRQIYGTLVKPQNSQAKKHPLAIIAHGFNGTMGVGNAYYRNLCELGYQCYAFDFPCGSVASKSDPNTMNMSVLDERSDVEAIIDHFRCQPDVDTRNIILIGESQGGFVSALAASRYAKKISKLVLVFPALCIPDNWNSRYPAVEDIPDTTRLWNVPMGKRFFQELRGLDVFADMYKFKKPVLIIQGDADRVVSVNDSRRAASLYPKSKLHIIKGAGHGFRAEEQAEAQRVLREWLTGK